MSLFIDVHDLPGPVSMEEAVKAHAADLQVQPEFGVHYLRHWVDERHGKIFALVDAPDAVAAHTVHRMAHGLVPGCDLPRAGSRLTRASCRTQESERDTAPRQCR
jgi:uncharacterized protein DUF4242